MAREIRQDRRETRSDVREYRQDRREGASRQELLRGPDGKSDPIDERYLVTGGSFDRIVAIYVATGAIFGAIGVTRDTENRVKGEEGKRGRGQERKRT